MGDWVIADDPTTKAEVESRQVLQTFVRQTDELFDLYIDGEVITTTDEHPFWVVGLGWLEAEDLEVGMLLQTSEETVVDVDGIEHRFGDFTVYNFEVEEFHTYFVSDLGILVHNSCYNRSDPNRINPNTLNINDLITASQVPIGKGGLTKAGRALDKHAAGQRGNSFFPPLKGNNTNKNLIADQQVNEILNHPNVVFIRLGRGGVEARVPDGRGIRFDANSSFVGFVD